MGETSRSDWREGRALVTTYTPAIDAHPLSDRATWAYADAQPVIRAAWDARDADRLDAALRGYVHRAGLACRIDPTTRAVTYHDKGRI